MATKKKKPAKKSTKKPAAKKPAAKKLAAKKSAAKKPAAKKPAAKKPAAKKPAATKLAGTKPAATKPASGLPKVVTDLIAKHPTLAIYKGVVPGFSPDQGVFFDPKAAADHLEDDGIRTSATEMAIGHYCGLPLVVDVGNEKLPVTAYQQWTPVLLAQSFDEFANNLVEESASS